MFAAAVAALVLAVPALVLVPKGCAGCLVGDETADHGAQHARANALGRVGEVVLHDVAGAAEGAVVAAPAGPARGHG